MAVDFATREAQGKAYSLNVTGVTFGLVIGVGVFVTLIRFLEIQENFKLIFFVSGMILVVFSLVTPFMLIEPPDLIKKKKL